MLSRRGHWLDLAQHLAEAWEAFAAAMPLYDPRTDSADALFSPGRSPDGRDEIRDIIQEWRAHDPLADRLPESFLHI